MQFTILGTTVMIVRNRKVEGALPDPHVGTLRTPEELLEVARRKALELQALGDTRMFY
ncbi:MAG TPA: hypothetical protein VNT75_12470 [Symbiobacteriaceae bacterium]|nr:hypothetical protein [Symbiobacteriaceae bacterium]